MRIPRLLRLLATCLSIPAAATLAAAEGVDQGPHGGHLVDAAGKYHLELVVKGRELHLHVSDLNDRQVPVAGASAKATVISGGGKGVVEMTPAGANVLRGSGTFAATRTMKVDVVLTLPGTPGPVTAKFQPLAAKAGGAGDHKGHRH